MSAKSRRQIRKRRCSSDSDDNSDTEQSIIQSLADAKELQKLRNRSTGVSAEALASGIKKKKEEEEFDPLKLKTGGFVDLKTVKRSELEGIEGVASFAAETNRRDEDTDMLKYVESELAKRRGTERQESDSGKTSESTSFHVPDFLRLGEEQTGSEDMLSNQMLSGIPEVDLGIEAKIKNIERTEEAKSALIKERMSQKETVSDFVPTNMAVNFVQHNRWNNPNEKSTTLVPHVSKQQKKEPVVQKKAEDPAKEKATDDLHYEKFKRGMRQFRR